MTWQAELFKRMKTEPWKDVLTFLKQAAIEKPYSAEVFIGALCFLVELLIEGPVEGRINFVREADEVSREIKYFFEKSSDKFSENAEYLFFVGYFMSLTDWNFGDDILEVAREMRKKASELEPENDLYLWGYRSSIWDRSAKSLAAKILSDSEKRKWLESKGCAGTEIIDALETKLDSSVWKDA